jgi:hypothetical protein
MFVAAVLHQSHPGLGSLKRVSAMSAVEKSDLLSVKIVLSRQLL